MFCSAAIFGHCDINHVFIYIIGKHLYENMGDQACTEVASVNFWIIQETVEILLMLSDYTSMIMIKMLSNHRMNYKHCLTLL